MSFPKYKTLIEALDGAESHVIQHHPHALICIDRDGIFYLVGTFRSLDEVMVQRVYAESEGHTTAAWRSGNGEWTTKRSDFKAILRQWNRRIVRYESWGGNTS